MYSISTSKSVNLHDLVTWHHFRMTGRNAQISAPYALYNNVLTVLIKVVGSDNSFRMGIEESSCGIKRCGVLVEHDTGFVQFINMCTYTQQRQTRSAALNDRFNEAMSSVGRRFKGKSFLISTVFVSSS
jgi:hypothetical protein